MSSLQISLAIIGGVLLALVVAWNAWTTHRNAPRKALPPERDAPPEPPHRLEPALDELDGAPDPFAAVHGLERGPEPAIHGVDAAQALSMPVPAAAHAAAERSYALDPLIDAIAAIALEQTVPGEAALAQLPPTRRAGSKPFAIEGQNDATGQWEFPQPGQRYRAFQAGVQLANRLGALNQIEFSEFVMKVQAFADALGAAPEFPDMLHEVARARELDQFASEHDAQLAFSLVARQAAWSPGYVQQNAARLGFVPGSLPGRLVLPGAQPGQAPLLSLGFDTQAALSDDPEQSAIRELALSLDVAHVPRTEQPFARLREVAAALCQSMDGVLCDQNGQPLPAMAMDPIAADLEQLYDQLDGRDLSAGSPQARRVFS
ncbi:MAG: cell division protein FtsZ [Burkholderiales bacterium 68-12]|nr:cell division protein FtsZ [Burkholderiales bacterium]OJX33972.1 MAG: cell division protein FtsZ [Burkholderiales bacterium 68-12]